MVIGNAPCAYCGRPAWSKGGWCSEHEPDFISGTEVMAHIVDEQTPPVSPQERRAVRVQLRRTKGWKMPPNTVVVSRPSKWGNPFDWRTASEEYGCSEFYAKAFVAMVYRDWLAMVQPERFAPELRPARVAILADLASLRGKNLACWCAPGSPCHADVLLEVANSPFSDGALPRQDEGSQSKGGEG